jgi:hypothetical protein
VFPAGIASGAGNSPLCQLCDKTEFAGLGKAVSVELVLFAFAAVFFCVVGAGFDAARFVCASVGNAPNKTLVIKINVKIRLIKMDDKFWFRIAGSPSIVFAPKFRLQFTVRKTSGKRFTGEIKL